MSDAVVQCKTCNLRQKGFCGDIPVCDLMGLASSKMPSRRLVAGSEIYRQGEAASLYAIVRSGWVALSVLLDDGRRHIFDFALPGAFLGVLPAPSTAYTHTARCITDVQICTLPRTQFDTFIQSRPAVMHNLLHVMVCNEARVQDHFVNVSGRAARARIAHLMVELFVRIHQRLPAHRGDQVMIPLTQSCIGEATSLTPVHVSRTFTTLEDEGILRFVRGVLTVLEPKSLLKAAGALGIGFGRSPAFVSCDLAGGAQTTA